jgi:hypothetical protein
VTAPVFLPRDVENLAGAVSGPVLAPDTPGYRDECSCYNLAIEHRPAVVVGAAGAADVQAAVRFAAEHDAPLGAHLTGHGPAVLIDSLLVNTRRLDELSVDPATKTARIGAGLRWGQVLAETMKSGLAALHGSSPSVGAIGYTAGGGMPLLAREYGYAADHVRAVELVTADGRLRRLTEDDDPDLFWGVRGGKGNFGIITAMEIGLVPVSRLYGGGLFFPGERAAEVLPAWREWSLTVPENMSTSLAFLRLPPLPEIPEPLRQGLVMHVRIAFTGSAADGEQLVAPLRGLGPRVLDTVAEMPYAAVPSIHMDPPEPIPNYTGCGLFDRLSDEALDELVAVAGPDSTCQVLLVEVRRFGGAAGRPPAVPNAVGNREAAFSLFVAAALPPGIEAAMKDSCDTVVSALAPELNGKTMLNLLTDHDGTVEQVATAFEPATYARLAALKKTYDPANLFRLCHNIPPAE